MNRLLFIPLLLISMVTHTCPTCTGRITPSSPPFFSDEFYTATADNMDEIYQAVIELPQDMVLTTSQKNTQENK